MDIGFWIAITALVVGLVLMLIEVLNPGFFLAIPATVLIVWGVFGAIWPALIWSSASLIVVPITTVIATVATLWGYRKWAPPQERPDTITGTSVVGMVGRIKAAVPPDGQGVIRIEGHDWRAVSSWPIPVGAEARVLSIDGFTLTVEPTMKE